jgi:hypothetical protein
MMSGDVTILPKNSVRDPSLLNAALSDICHSPTAAPFAASSEGTTPTTMTASTPSTCSTWFAQLAKDMQRKSNCAADLAENNAVANQALISASLWRMLP